MWSLVLAWLLVGLVPAIIHAASEEPMLVLEGDGAPIARPGLTELLERRGEERAVADQPSGVPSSPPAGYQGRGRRIASEGNP